MLFTSFGFIFLFLPVVVTLYFLSARLLGLRVAIPILVIASWLFYCWWNPIYLILLLTSILINYFISRLLSGNINHRRTILIVGVAINLSAIGYFKYANFFLESVNSVTGAEYFIPGLIIPLGISFFTFQQIAFLVDAYRREATETNLMNYALFVSFFPQLIAGPIVHHKEMMPQFMLPENLRPQAANLAMGVSIFAIGLVKKVVIADGMGPYADRVFGMADAGLRLSSYDAWLGTLAYTFQIYFDFSGYSDMAIGLACIFGVRLPINFFSPYRANNIIEFWRRWHMTLSRFLRDYLYVPLGGNRKGKWRRYVNLLVTMLLGGLWHGASWNFIVWGGLHGIYLVINHAWRSAAAALSLDFGDNNLWIIFSRSLTFISVIVAWVWFRSETTSGALNMLTAMFDVSSFSVPEVYQFIYKESTLFNYLMGQAGISLKIVNYHALMFLSLIIFVMFAPSSMEIFSFSKENQFWPKSVRRIIWRPTLFWATGISIIYWVALFSAMARDYEEFIYWSF